MSGVYKTKQKDIISECIREFKTEHFSVDDVLERITSQGESIGRSTVYRYLEDLHSKGELIKYKFDEKDVACYQNKGCDKCDHFHLKCTSCSKLFHAECSFFDNLTEHIDEHHKFQIDASKIVLYGLCQECREKKI